MPMYTYRCEKCGYSFQELKPYEKRDEGVACTLCGGVAQRNAAELFGIHTTIDSRTETVYTDKEIDKVVGEASSKKWAMYEQKRKERKEKKWKGAEPKPINMPRGPDGKFAPLMSLGDNSEKSIRKEYVSALQEHRSARAKKGESQFEGPGLSID
jgi:putative FmdB family regulatory protein